MLSCRDTLRSCRRSARLIYGRIKRFIYLEIISTRDLVCQTPRCLPSQIFTRTPCSIPGVLAISSKRILRMIGCMYYTTSLFEDIFPRYPVVNIRDNASSGKGGISLHLIDLSAGSWHHISATPSQNHT
jgi:hypothetical protein